jgi:hypothetical protein
VVQYLPSIWETLDLIPKIEGKKSIIKNEIYVCIYTQMYIVSDNKYYLGKLGKDFAE